MTDAVERQPSAEGLRPIGILSVPAVAMLLVVGAFVVPTMRFVAESSWSTEQGAHGPIVLFTGLWLLLRHARDAITHADRPPTWRVALLMALVLPAYAVARIGSIVELEGYLMYAGLLTLLYSMVGGAVMRRMWFPLFYLTFVFPPPDTLVAIITQPLKIYISLAAVKLLTFAGYPVGGEGVFIYIGQYQLLVAAACSGLNSLISLTALSLLYIYIRHQADVRYAIALALLTVPVALLANLVRVLMLILLTYHFGEAAGQGFLHEFAGLTMFVAALVLIMTADFVLMPLFRKRYSGADHAPEARALSGGPSS